MTIKGCTLGKSQTFTICEFEAQIWLSHLRRYRRDELLKRFYKTLECYQLTEQNFLVFFLSQKLLFKPLFFHENSSTRAMESRWEYSIWVCHKTEKRYIKEGRKDNSVFMLCSLHLFVFWFCRRLHFKNLPKKKNTWQWLRFSRRKKE